MFSTMVGYRLGIVFLDSILFYGVSYQLLSVLKSKARNIIEREWKLIIETLRGAEEQLVRKGRRVSGSKCTILMDLAGPKIRTGPMEHKVRPIQISAPKDIYDRPVRFSEGYLDS